MSLQSRKDRFCDDLTRKGRIAVTPNGFAYMVLALWPFVSIALFRTQPVGRAIIASFLIAYLFLPPYPTGFNFPLVPEMNKHTLPSVTAFLICFFMYGRKMTILPESTVARALIITFIFSPMLTALSNGDPVFFGRFAIQPLGFKEGLSMILNNAIIIIPFILAMNFLRSEQDLRDVLLALLIGALVYSLPMLLEVRMSPQLNTWIYGFFQHSFGQMMRDGGYRPIVFLYHGLWVAFYCFTAVVAALSLYRYQKFMRKPAASFLWAGIYLTIVLILCKSLGSLMYALLAIPLLLYFSAKLQMRLAMVMVALALCYPVLKGNQLVPEQALINQAYAINPERAGSLHYRLVNEGILLDRAGMKPLFGWGSFGRSLIHSSDGQILSIPDGRWVITLGSFGWTGFIAEFGLLALPLFLLMSKFRAVRASHVSPIFGGLALILGFNMIDLLPNATLTPLSWLLSGALLGYYQSLRTVRARPRPQMQAIL